MVLSVTFPTQLAYASKTYLPNGDGPERSSKVYRTGSGATITCVLAKVLSTSSRFAVLKVLGNEMENCELLLPPAWLKEGHYVLILVPRYEGGRHVTRAVWPCTVREKAVKRHIGTIYKVHPNGKFGFVREDGTGKEPKVDVERLRGGARLVEGARVTYCRLLGDRGEYADDVRPVRSDLIELS